MPSLGTLFRWKRESTLPRGPLSACPKQFVEAPRTTIEGPLFTPGGTPSWAGQPWHYVFQNGDVAWALGPNKRWRLVRVVGDGFAEKFENRMQLAYNATWTSDGAIMRGTFAPGSGDVKPNTLAIRRLLFDEGQRHVERRDWDEVLNEEEYSDSEIESEESEAPENDDRV
ncbi:hypothetical protein BC827DRAFT_1193154 [Russula dissimulans]|nr:hypothetical protein BC827DRAFT_1193154 [Russula dissimulans]